MLVDADELIFATLADESITVVAGSLTGTSNYRTLDDLQASLDPGVFWRVHRSYLVNINKIKEIVPWFSRNYILKMNDGKATEIPVSRSQTQPAAGIPPALTPSAVGDSSSLPDDRPLAAAGVDGAAWSRGGRRRSGRQPRPAAAARCGRRPSAAAPAATPPPCRLRHRADGLGAPRRGAPHVVQDARLGGGLRHADRHLRLSGRARRGPEHVAHARGSGSADRQQADLPAERAASAATS